MKNVLLTICLLTVVAGCIQNGSEKPMSSTSMAASTTTIPVAVTTTSTVRLTTSSSTSTTLPGPAGFEIHEWGMISAENTEGPFLLTFIANSIDSQNQRQKRLMRRSDEITYPSDVRVYFDAEKKLAIFENKGAYPVYEIFAIAPTKNARVLGKYIYSNVVPKLEAGSETKVPLIERKADYNITEELKKQGFTVSEASEFSGIWADKAPNTKKSLGMLSYRASPEELEAVSGSIDMEPEASKTLQSLYVLVTLTGRDYLPPVIGTGFGIYQGQMLIISEEDIIDYNRTSHEIRLTPEGLMKLRSRIPYEEEKGELVPKLGGLYLKPFTVRLNGQEIYSGTFWSSASSQSNDGVVLLDVLSILSQDRIKLQAGYPSKEYFKGADPRDNTQLMNYLEGKSKLVT